MNTKLMASVVVITYNQHNALLNVISGLCNQTMDRQEYEVIIIDDGSTDETILITSEQLQISTGLNIQIKHTTNGGRARARNIGVSMASGRIIVFCDGDRVPAPSFIKNHTNAHMEGMCAVIGASYDYFGKSELLDRLDNWSYIMRFSRLPFYFQRVSKIYNQAGVTDSKNAWLSFLVGNASVDREIMLNIGGFDERFIQWGFEHFELGYRLMQNNIRFRLSLAAMNFHQPHPREFGFYEKNIRDNINKIKNIHPEIDEQLLIKTLLEAGELSN